MAFEMMLGTAQTLAISMLIYFLQRKQKKWDDEARRRSETRKKESLLLLELNMACAKLAYAVAVAVKTGKANGEVEEGVKAYEEAKKKYFSFLNEQAKDNLER